MVKNKVGLKFGPLVANQVYFQYVWLDFYDDIQKIKKKEMD